MANLQNLFKKGGKKDKPDGKDIKQDRSESASNDAGMKAKSIPDGQEQQFTNESMQSAPMPTPKPVANATAENVPDEDDLMEIANESNVGDILNNLIREAMELNASDIHLEPREGDMVVRLRIDGMLREITTIPKKLEQALVFKIKIVARIRTDEHFAPQDGRIRFMLEEGGYVDTRISILPVTKGAKVVMRLLSSSGKGLSLAELGIVDRELDIVQKSYSKPYGMIISAGPTGSGKTTTLYSILQNINSKEINISTIEDPVEYDLEGVNHVQVNTKTGLTFPTGLRALLRQDPDVIMIGEIRDPETARIATNAALTGHLVLTTVHTNDAVTTIPRMIDMGIEDFLVASTVNIVIAQRLARRLCDECKKPYELSKFEFTNLLLKSRPDIAEFIKTNEKLHRPVGCDKCGGTGYRGRVGLYEILEINETLRKAIATGATTDEIFALARKNGLKLIVEDGIKKLKAGLISISELTRVTAIKE